MDKAILCNLLSYEVKEVELSDLYSKCENSSIQDAVISYFQDLADQKPHIYALNYDHDSGFLGSLKDPNKCISLTSLKCEDDLINGVIVMILDLFLIGQCTLKKESFTSELDAGNMPEIYKERHEALQFFALFLAKLCTNQPESLPELNHIVTSCLENKYIKHNLNSFDSSVSASSSAKFSIEEIGERLSSLYMRHRLEDSKLPVMNQESRIDNLINICNIFTSQTCKVCII